MSPPPRAPQNPTPPTCPSLPPELWIRILTYHPDPIHLWTTCRTVSSSFRKHVDSVFASTHLRFYTCVSWSLEKYNLGGKSQRPEIPCTFVRFGDGEAGKKRVYFGDKRERSEVVGSISDGVNGKGKGKGKVVKGRAKDFDRVMDRWEERVSSSKAETPHYTLKIGRLVNDTALPGLSFDKERREIGFEWREMLRLFFREQERLKVLRGRYHVEVKELMERNRRKLSKGERLTPDDLPKSWAAVEPDVRKRIRRERLKECYKGNEEMLWAIESLKIYEKGKAADGRALQALSEIPGAGMGERWFGSTYLLQALYLDEWSCMHKIDTKGEHLDADVDSV